MTNSTMRQRVAKGAAFFDERDPGWFDCINPERLNVANAMSCPVGQIYWGSFDFARTIELVLGISQTARVVSDPGGFKLSARAAELGLCAQGNNAREYPVLTRLWQAIVRERQIAAGGLVDFSLARV